MQKLKDLYQTDQGVHCQFSSLANVVNYRKLKIDFPLSFHIFLNVRKALFYQLYGHFSFRLILPNRHVLSRFFMVNRGKYRGKTLGYHAP